MQTRSIGFGFIVLLLFLTMGIGFVQGLSASIGNARMVLNTQIPPDKMVFVERTIRVVNINNVSVNIQMTPVGELEGITQILDNDFTLQPDEEKQARFRVRIIEPGYYEGAIAVGFSPAEEGAGSGGVGLQSSIIINAWLNESAQGYDIPDELLNPPEDGEDSDPGSVPTGEGDGQDAGTDGEDGTKIIKGTGSGPSLIIGILIIVVILAIGLVTYLIITKRIR